MLIATLPNFANNEYVKNKKNTTSGDDTIVSLEASNEKFTTLVAAVKAIRLVNVWIGDGPFTVLAPVNSADAKLSKGAVPTLLRPKYKHLLTSILTYQISTK